MLHSFNSLRLGEEVDKQGDFISICLLDKRSKEKLNKRFATVSRNKCDGGKATRIYEVVSTYNSRQSSFISGQVRKAGKESHIIERFIYP